MRGDDRYPDSTFSYVWHEQRVPPDHPLRAIRGFVDDALRDMSREFDALYASVGRPSIPPAPAAARPAASSLLFDSQRAPADGAVGRQHAVRWFVGLEMDEPVWDATVFTKNRDRLITQEVALSFFRRVVARAEP